jgi:hypothetical protein
VKLNGFSKKFKDFFGNRRNVIILIVVVSLLILGLVKLLFLMIYTQDKPDFIPEETKGEIRKGIEDTVGQGVKNLSPDLGQAIIDASYDSKNSSSTSFGTDKSDWVVYRDSEIDISFTYPPTSTVTKRGEVLNIVNAGDENVQGEVPLISIDTSLDLNGTSNIPGWIDSHKSSFIGDQNINDVPGFANKKPFIIGKHTGFYVEWDSMGATRSYVFLRNGRVVIVTVLPADSDQIRLAEDLISSM